jgi:hypothetical protein
MFDFFKKKNAQSKKQPEDDLEDVQSALTYYVKSDGEIFVDVNLVDYSEETLNNFAKILAGISSLRFQLQTVDMVKHGFLEAGKLEAFKQLLSLIVLISREDVQAMESFTKTKLKGEEPCIKPSDML